MLSVKTEKSWKLSENCRHRARDNIRRSVKFGSFNCFLPYRFCNDLSARPNAPHSHSLENQPNPKIQ